MQEDSDRREAQDEDPKSRPQRAGEAATTRFGMEEGDNTDTPATGDGTREENSSS